MKLTKKTILVTGASGFLGSHIVGVLKSYDVKVLTPGHAELDLVSLDGCRDYFSSHRPDLVIHCAGAISGLLRILDSPADIFDTNVRININVLKASQETGVEKLVNIGSTCAYPGELPTGYFREEAFFDGPMHRSVESYGFSKRAMVVGSTAYRQQYGLNSITLLLTNMYGPWDVFSVERAHVASALIKKFMVAKRNNEPAVEVLGTGKAVREFLYVEDAAEAILLAAEKYDDALPLNVGSGEETPIVSLAQLIKELTGYTGTIRWNTDGPDGALRKVSDISRIRRLLGWKPRYFLREGLKKTIKWFDEHYDEAVTRL